MKTIEKLIIFLFPRILLKGTLWEKLWKLKEKEQFISVMRIFFPIAAFGQVVHYYTVDHNEGLAPSTLWFNYRFGIAFMCLICFGLYYKNKIYEHFKFYRVPFILSFSVIVYFQTRTIIWYNQVPYIYSYVFIIIGCLLLNSDIFRTMVFASFLCSIIYPTIIESGVSNSMAFSASFFSLMVVIFTRTKHLSEINYFIATQKNIAQQKAMIELSLEFTNQIKAFLPDQISKRLTNNIQANRMNVTQAIDDVLRPRKKNVACLFSDIRGFTNSSNDLDGFVQKAMLPNVKMATKAIEKYEGISRKIGDLIFAYYDSDSMEKNIRNLIVSCFQISKINNELNASLDSTNKIKRYVLASYGEAVVGNLSSYDSAIEITAIGAPVNILARIDELTKFESIKSQLKEGDLIITEELFEIVLQFYPSIQYKKLNLTELNVKIRNFENVNTIYNIVFCDYNYNYILDYNNLMMELVA